MKVLSKLKAKPGIWMTDAKEPSVGHNDVLIKIKKTAICGTDLHIYSWDDWAQKTIKVPMVIGHEFVGEVCQIGSEVAGYEIGDRVSGEGHIVCGYCRNCRAGMRHLCPNTIGVGVDRDGAFAEYLVIPKGNVFKVPDSIKDEVASIFDPYGNAVHTALSFDLIGEDILITGAGPIGIMAVAIARHVGARRIVITDINDYRLDMAKKMGATVALNVKNYSTITEQTDKLQQVMRDIGMKEGFDIAFEVSGHDVAINAMINSMTNGGKISILGIAGKSSINLDWNKIVWKGLKLKGIYGREMYETWYKMTSMIDSGLDISPVITHQLNISDYQEGFDIMAQGQCGKVILDWT